MPELVLRPTVRHRPWVLAPVVLFAGPFAVAGVLIGWPVGLIPLALAAAVVVPVTGVLVRSRIVVTPSEIIVRGFVTRRRADRAQAASIVRAVIVAPRGPISDTIFVLDRDEKPLLRIYGTNYARADLDRLVARLGLPAGTADRPITAAQLAGRYPGIVSWAEQHPFKLACGVTLVVVPLVLIVAWIVTAATL